MGGDQRLSPFKDLLCGAAAGASARIVVAPLDVLKIRFQVQAETPALYRYASMSSAFRTIVSTEGPRALWKGNVSAMLMIVPYASVQLTTFYQLQQSNILSVNEPYQSLSLGAIAGASATITTYPLDLLRTRFAAQTEPKVYHNIRHAVQLIYNARGLSGFYAGLQPTLIEIVPYISLHFALYEASKSATLEGTHRTQLRPDESMILGALAGTTSKFLTLPLDNAKKLMQVQAQFTDARTSASPYRGIADVLTSVWRREGIRGCFRGTAPSLLKAAPNSAITFTIYEAAKRYVSGS